MPPPLEKEFGHTAAFTVVAGLAVLTVILALCAKNKKRGNDSPTTAACQSSESFCGPQSVVTTKKIRKPPTRTELEKDRPVAFSAQRQVELVSARAKLKAEKVAKLISDTPRSFTPYDDGTDEYHKSGRADYERRNIPWMLDAVEHAYLDTSIGTALKEVLSDHLFIVNLGFFKLWQPLQDGANVILSRIGGLLLAPLYSLHHLAERMSNQRLGQYYMMHKSEAPKGVKPSQRQACPELFDVIESQLCFDDLGEANERVSLLCVLLLAHLLADLFKEQMEKTKVKCGCSLSVAPPKGYARALVKL
jgi:hypothetical protein